MYRKRSKEEAVPGVVLPITPMLDMTFQIFAFFIMTYNPAEGLREGYMDFNLPATGEMRAQDDKDIDPNQRPDTDLKIESELTVIIKTVRDNINDGAISSIAVQSPQDTTSVENLPK